MKINHITLIILFVLSFCANSQKETYKGSPVINAKSNRTEFRIGNNWYKNKWSIAPQIAHDTLEIIYYKPNESFQFNTDIDSIIFNIPENTTKDFYVRMNENTYAHTIIKGIPFQPNQLKFNTDQNQEISIKYQTEQSNYLESLKDAFPLNFVNNKMSDTEVALAVLNWTNSRWEHNGNKSPSKNDAITILNEAQEGNQFPCFAYAVVLRDQLTALGYNARTIYLKTEDAEYRKSSPGHVATEVFLDDLQKWIFLDGQFNLMPTLNDIPLNAVEFQNAISNHFNELKLQSLSKTKTSKESYIEFVYDYLFYFDTALDNRYESNQEYKINDKSSIMLVPSGTKELTHINFWNMDVDYCIYTNSKQIFYAKPQ